MTIQDIEYNALFRLLVGKGQADLSWSTYKERGLNQKSGFVVVPDPTHFISVFEQYFSANNVCINRNIYCGRRWYAIDKKPTGFKTVLESGEGVDLKTFIEKKSNFFKKSVDT